MKNLKEVLYIFCGLSIIFILIYFAEHSKRKPVDFDSIVRRAATWESIIEAIQSNDHAKRIVVRFLYPAERKGATRIYNKTTYYDCWLLGGKDYTEFWRRFHAPENDILRDEIRSGAAGVEAQWFLREASYVGEMKEEYIDASNYFNVNLLRGLILADNKSLLDTLSNNSLWRHICPFLRRLRKANLMNEQDIENWGEYQDSYCSGVLAYIYTTRLRTTFLYNSAKRPDLPALNNRYRNNLKLLSGSQKDELLKQTLTSFNNIKQAEELPVAETCDSKTLLALSEVLKLLEKAGIKEVHSLTVLPENPAREYLCIPVKINAILTYGQLKSLSDAVGSASTLSIIDFLAVINCDLKMTDVKPLLEKGLPFYQARCMVIIEFITGLPDKK